MLMSVRRPGAALRCFVVFCVVLCAGPAAGHGGVSIEDDTCIMTIGPYRAHFSGYQPRVRASREFCENIPVVADAIIVLDFISSPLREMTVDFRIVRDVNNIGVDATYDDLGSPDDIEAATEIYKAAASYPTGNFDVTLRFDAPGAFIGIMTATNPETGDRYSSVFPFTVGRTSWGGTLTWVFVVLLAVAGVAAFVLRDTTTRAD